MAVAAQQPAPGSSAVDEALDRIVQTLGPKRSSLILTQEAQRLVDWMREANPDALVDWFEEHLVRLLAQQLQVRLASERRAGRRGVFAGTAEPDELPRSPFDLPYSCPDGIWKPLGDMVRPDWRHIIEDRSGRASASLFEVELGRRIVAKMKDDETLTREVLDEAELERLEAAARKRAEGVVDRFKK